MTKFTLFWYKTKFRLRVGIMKLMIRMAALVNPKLRKRLKDIREANDENTLRLQVAAKAMKNDIAYQSGLLDTGELRILGDRVIVSDASRVQEHQHKVEQTLLSADAERIEVGEIELTEEQMHEMLAEIRDRAADAAFSGNHRFSTGAARRQFEETLPRCDNIADPETN